MYAIIEHRGRQYRVSEGDCLQLDYLPQAHGDPIEFDQVLAVGGRGKPQIGKPTVEGAVVLAEVIEHRMGPKIKVQRFRRRKGVRRLRGHRQLHTDVRVREIRFPGKSGRSRAAAKEEEA